MIKCFLILSALGVVAANASAVTLDFEGFPGGFQQIPSPYMGVNFSAGSNYGSEYIDTTTNYATHSGVGYALSETGLFEGTLASGTATDFSFYYTNPYALTTAHMELWLSGSLVATSADFAQVSNSTNFVSMTGVEFDTFRVVETNPVDGQFYGYYAIDDVTFTTNAVPEPASMAALGLGGLALLRRRKSA